MMGDDVGGPDMQAAGDASASKPQRGVIARPTSALTLIVLGAVLLRLVLLAIAWRHTERLLQFDSGAYLAIGRNFGTAVLHGRGPFVPLSVYRPPGYPAFIALIAILSNSVRLLVLVQIGLA